MKLIGTGTGVKTVYQHFIKGFDQIFHNVFMFKRRTPG